MTQKENWKDECGILFCKRNRYFTQDVLKSAMILNYIRKAWMTCVVVKNSSQ